MLKIDFTAAEHVRERTDADLFALEQTGFFSRLLAEMPVEPFGEIEIREAA